MDSIDLNLLKALNVLLEERHVSRAAARFHLSQSAMSRTLTRLRETFDDELLVRAGSGYELTPRARTIQRELLFIMPRLQSLVVRHEAQLFRMEVKDLCLSTVVAVERSWRKPEPGIAGEGGSSLDKVVSVQNCRMGRAR